MAEPFIPNADDQFDGFFTALNTYVQANFAALGLDSTAQGALNNAH